MTQIEWQQLEATVAKMTDEEKQRLECLLHSTTARSDLSSNPSLGLFADEPELIDEIMKGVYEARERHPFRTGE